MSKFCNQCGYELKDDQLFCPSCGTKSQVVVVENATATPENPATATSNPAVSANNSSIITTNPATSAINPATATTNSSAKAYNIDEHTKKKSFHKVPIIIGSVATIIVIAAVIIVRILWFSDSYNSPLESYTKGINSADARMVQKAFSPTIAYASYYFEDVDTEFADKLDGLKVKISVVDKTHVKKSDIKDILEKDDFNRDIPETMTVQDCYMVVLAVTIKQDDKTNVETYDNIPIVKLEGVWYIADPSLLYIFN